MPPSPAVARAMALGSLGSLACASCIQLWNKTRGSERGAMPPSSKGPPVSIVMASRPSSLASARVALRFHAPNPQVSSASYRGSGLLLLLGNAAAGSGADGCADSKDLQFRPCLL